ncbi:MAG: DUF2914 domain-containing protein [Elusimicrobia bacterium]|nr:DUF2914 domain-containing protein [Elusimicrobiota bacterium]
MEQNRSRPVGDPGRPDRGVPGWAAKANYAPGRWRVSVVTEDDRSLGGVNFTVAPDPSAEPRVVKIRRM